MGVANNINNRVRIFTLEGIEIWEGDYSSVSEKEHLQMTKAQTEYSKSRQNEVSYFLLNVEKTPKSIKAIEASKKAMLDSQGTTSLTCLYKVDALGRILLKIINITKNNKIVAFEKREDALDFLIKRAKQINQSILENNIRKI